MSNKKHYNSMEQLSAMKVDKLKEVAPEFEVKITEKMKKADIIKAIFDSKLNVYIDADAPTEDNAVKTEEVKKETSKESKEEEVKADVKNDKKKKGEKPVFKKPRKVGKRRMNFQ